MQGAGAGFHWAALYYNQAVVYSVKRLKEKRKNSYNELIRRAGKTGPHDRARYLSAAYYNLAFMEADQSQIDRAFTDLDEALKLAADLSVYDHDLVSNRSLTALRSDERFVPLMRRYWPGYARQTGRFPVASPSDDPSK